METRAYAGTMLRVYSGKLLTKDEEIALAKRKDAGDEAARQELVTKNLRLVIRPARKYATPAMPLEDLFQHGCLGLMRGVEKYDYKKGFRVSTYVMSWIYQAISRAVDNQSSLIRVPMHTKDKMRKYVSVKLKAKEEPFPVEEAAKRAEISRAKAEEFEALSKLQSLVSLVLNEDFTEGGGAGKRDFLKKNCVVVGHDAGIERRAETKNLHEAVMAIIRDTLSYKQLTALYLRFSEEKTLAEAGLWMGLSKERVRQIEVEALKKAAAAVRLRGI